LLDRYDELLAVSLTDSARLRGLLASQGRVILALVLCQPCSDMFRADLLPHSLAVGGGGGEAVPGDVDEGGA
jgi:hypothetical protein